MSSDSSFGDTLFKAIQQTKGAASPQYSQPNNRDNQGWEKNNPGNLDKILVRRADLITAIEKNLAAHTKEVEEATAGYRREVVRALEKEAEVVKAGGDFKGINLDKPENHIKDYELILRMLRLSIQDTIEITSQQFRWYVMDEWPWKSAFAITSTRYR